MKRSIKSSFVAGIVTLSLFTTIGYVSCTKTSNDPCTSTTCYNGGTCSNAKCSCPTGYEGANCQYSWGDRLAGSWNITSTVNTNPNNPTSGTLVIAAIPNDPTHFTISGVFTQDITCTLSADNAFTFDAGTYANTYGSYVITGSTCTVSSDGLTITGSYTYTYFGNTDVVQFTMTR